MGQRGDTIIEVLFAITVFSVLAVTSLTLMNQGSATVQRSLEISHVRNEIDAQADGLRYAHDSYVSTLGADAASSDHLWAKIIDKAIGAASNFNEMTQLQICGGSNPLNTKAFALNMSQLNIAGSSSMTSTFARASTYAQLRSDMATVQSDGLWIEAVKGNSAGTTPGYYDFHIRACWDAPGQQVPMTLGTIVRLYEP